MKKADQKRFVKNLGNSVIDAVLLALKENRIPERWDGTELRQLLADKFRSPEEMQPERRKAYETIAKQLGARK